MENVALKSDTPPRPKVDDIEQLTYRPTRNIKHLPGEDGWPLVNHTFAFLRNAPALVERLHAKHGSIFRFTVFGNRIVAFADPDDVAMVLKDKAQNFSNRRGWMKMQGLFDGGILVRDFENHKPHRMTLQKAFNQAAMNQYTIELNKLISEELESWRGEGEFLFSPRIKSLLLNNAAATFLGADLGQESDKLNQAFIDLLGGLLVLKRTNRKGSAWQKSQQGKHYLRKWLYARVEERRERNGTDFFSSLCRESQNPEHLMSTDDVVDHTLLLLFGAHDTITSTLTNMVSLLCEHPTWQEKLRQEVLSIDGNQLLKDDLAKLEQCDRVFKETLRLFPPVFMIPRRAIDSFEHKGHVIPKNTSIQLLTYLIHRSEKHWTHPNQFDPERFSQERSEHKKNRFQYIPFGGGAHTCLGMKFAETQAKIFLFHFLRRYQAVTRAGRSKAMDSLPIPIPKDKLPIRLQAI